MLLLFGTKNYGGFMKTWALFFVFFTSASALASSDYECKRVETGILKTQQVCFPIDHQCYDPHGIGDGNPIAVDCWTGGSRACNRGSANWPVCAGGFIK